MSTEHPRLLAQNRLRKRIENLHAADNRRLDPLMRTLKALHSVTSPEDMTHEELERQRKNQDILGKLTAKTAGLEWREFALDKMPAAWMRVQRPHKRRRAVLYCHGGGYTSGNLGYSKVLAAKLAQATGFDVLTFEYRLAPEHPYPAAAEDALAAWNHLMYLGYGARDIVVAGDSAGGNLALELCGRLKHEGRILPGALLLMSPWTDMTMSGASYKERAAIDPMLTLDYIEAVRKAYANGVAYAAPELSPLFADLSGYPPTLIQVGTHEILYSDSFQLQKKLDAQHVANKLEVYENMWHVFQMFPIKKASAAIDSIPAFLLEYLD